jgi:phosphonatase-like hydrolase
VPNAAESAASIHADFVDRMKRFYRTDASVVAVDGALDVFHALHAARVTVTLDTGFDRVIADTVLDRLGWSEWNLISATVTSDEVVRGRPHPDMIFTLMQKIGISEASAVAKIGDTPSDLLSGAAAGCGWNIGVTTGTHSRRALEPYPHTHLIDQLRELPALFEL